MFADKLYSLPSFLRQYNSLLELSVCNTFPKLIWASDVEVLLGSVDWNNMLGIASALSFSDKNEHLDAALRVAQTALVEEATSNIHKEAAAAILNSLTNKPAIKLAIERHLLSDSFFDRLPFSVKLSAIRADIETSIYLNGQALLLNRFQKRVYDSYLENEAISISAPTSSGKSFILCNIVLEEISKNSQTIVYLVPTRALISQVELDLTNLFIENDIRNINVSTVPLSTDELSSHNVLVFTQERLHWFLIENQNIQIDTIIVDEAQKIEDGYRGILLQQKLEQVLEENPNAKIYFSSPFTSNPELLLDAVSNYKKKDTVNTQFVSVNQNLIFVKQVPRKTDLWNLSLCLSEGSINLGEVKLSDRPTTEKKKVVFLLNALSDDEGGNIVYCNGAAEAEETAKLLSSTIGEEELSSNIKDLIKLVKKTIHKKYALAETLEKRVAFHYGNMPLLIRQEIESLFKNGEIKHLLCTSTLLEGVNLPARSIFIRKPTRGRGSPLNQNDFWNLAGRAGRWGKEFSGNIICIDALSWDVPPNPVKTKQKITRAIDEIERNGEELIDYIDSGSSREEAEKNPKLEFAFGYYYNRFLSHTLNEENDFHAKVKETLNEVSKEITLPDYIIRRNPGISPIAQQELLKYFESKGDDIESLIPVYPEDDNALEEYTKLIGRIGKTISKYPPQLNVSRAILLINWMSGKSLAYIISARQKSYEKSKKHNKKLSRIIRDVMSEVENFARFRFAKDSSCYIDVLRYFLEVTERHDYVRKIPQLNLWLEFGVSQKTHISLLSLGLSRNTVIELTEHLTNSEMTIEECIAWLANQDFETMEISPIVIEDISKKMEQRILV